jgi:hypothetical protein
MSERPSQSRRDFSNNWPETPVRDPDSGVPFFADAEHLMSDANVPGTGVGWDVMQFHAIDWEVERLMWAWQAGYRVIGFDGVPSLDHSQPLSDTERLAARDEPYRLSSQGRA